MLPFSEGDYLINLTLRQLEIIRIVRQHAPIIGDQIAEMLGISRPTIRSDLSVLVMLGYLDAKPKVGYFLGTAMAPEVHIARTLEEIKVKDVQGMPVISRDISTVHDAVVTLFLENVGSLIIADTEGTLAGIVSRKDLLKATLGNANASTLPVGLVMTRQPNVVTIFPEESVLEAARRMKHHQVDSLPVVIQSPNTMGIERLEVVGRITKTTLMGVLLDLSSAPKMI